MTMPARGDWLFAIKTFAAAMLALFLAMWLDLPRPYWAVGTVYITSQMLAGATRSKALYRICGTLLGAAVALALVPNLVASPELLTLAVAAWVGLCLYVALLDRTPRSYVMMLAGYTAALIGFPSVGEPGAIFDTAVARAEEIALGILCASLVSSIVLPRSAVPAIAARLDLWLGEARGWARGLLDPSAADAESRAVRLRLASDALAFDAMATHLRHEGAGRSAKAMAVLRQHMLMILPIVVALGDRAEALERAGALPAPVRSLLDETRAWLDAGKDDPAESGRLRDAAAALEPGLGAKPAWEDLVLASLLARLRDLIDLGEDMRRLRRHIVEGTPLRGDPAFRYTAEARTVRHRDHGMALRSALGVVFAVLVAGAIWILTGWPDGAGAPMMAAVGCCLFASQDDPTPQIMDFATGGVIGALAAAVYLFAILPMATSFETVVLALAPGLILAGLSMTQPTLAMVGMGSVVNGFTMLALQGSYSGDFVAFANSAASVVAGVWIGAITTRLVRSVGAERTALRLRRVNRISLAEATAGRGARHGLELAALMLDRVGLIASRLAALPPEEARGSAALLADIRVGINVVELRRARRHLGREAGLAIERLLRALTRHYRADPAAPSSVLLSDVDAALEAAAADPGPAARRAALLGLVGIRRGLFPDAAAYAPRVVPQARLAA